MNFFSSSQSNRKLVKRLKEECKIDEQTALGYLKKHSFNYDKALKNYRKDAAAPARSNTPFEKFFQAYSDPASPEHINEDQMVRLITDLRLDAESFAILVLAWKCQAVVQSTFSRANFMSAMEKLNANSVEELRDRLLILEKEVQDSPNEFRSVYTFAFKFCPPKDNSITLDDAIIYWKILFNNSKTLNPIVQRWIAFIEPQKLEKVSWDLWDMFLHFIQRYSIESLDDYNVNDMWPILIDDFVSELKNNPLPTHQNDAISDNELCVAAAADLTYSMNSLE